MKTKSILMLGLALVIAYFALLDSVSAQKTLQFNQVKLVTTQETVPAGMTWKVENILPSTRLSSAAAILGSSITTEAVATEQIIKVNDVNVYMASSNAKSQARESPYNGYPWVSTSSASAYGILQGPIWLPEGTTLAAFTGVYAISIMEFIVTP